MVAEINIDKDGKRTDFSIYRALIRQDARLTMIRYSRSLREASMRLMSGLGSILQNLLEPGGPLIGRGMNANRWHSI